MNYKILGKDYKFYYLVSMSLYVCLGFMKGMGGRQMMLIVFLIIPGVDYLKYLSKDKSIIQ